MNGREREQCNSPLPPILQEASYDYMEKEGERTFLECLDQLEVANARLDDVSVLSVGVIRFIGINEQLNDWDKPLAILLLYQIC